MNEHSHSVLIVDDEEDIRSMLALSLKHAGYDVRTATDGVEALDEMRQRDFDVVVTDYQMPHMDGLEFLSLSKVLWPDIPVVMISGDQSAQVADMAMRNGAFTWIHKPYERAVLLQVLRLATRQPPHEPVSLATARRYKETESRWRTEQR